MPVLSFLSLNGLWNFYDPLFCVLPLELVEGGRKGYTYDTWDFKNIYFRELSV
jgi:hypothetical protein